MESCCKNVRMFSIVAMVWSLGEGVLHLLNTQMGLNAGAVEENLSSANNIQEFVVYFVVFLTGVMGLVAINKIELWKISMAVGVISVLTNVAMPILTGVPFSLITIAFPAIISFWIFKMHEAAEKKKQQQQQQKSKKKYKIGR